MKQIHSKYNSTLENDFQRDCAIGYDLEDSIGFLRCIEHGAPHPLIRWHHHEEYELHLITSTKGKMFVGDYIGDFKPGSLILTGPYLPHNWVSDNLPEGGVFSRDISLQFSAETFRKACELLPELNQVLPLLDRAKNGIEFFGISDFAKQKLIEIKNKKGIHSLNEFLILISKLAIHTEYQLLSNVQLQSCNKNSKHEFSDIFDYITKNYNTQLTMADIAEQNGMESSSFSRCFKKASGITFTEFVNRMRINNACKLLNETDKFISTIGYHVGFNNIANFNRRFVQIKKTTPSEYRKQSLLKFS